MEARTFTCQDCGIVVHAFSAHANDVDICMECLWLRSVEDPVERAALRKFLNKGKEQ